MWNRKVGLFCLLLQLWPYCFYTQQSIAAVYLTEAEVTSIRSELSAMRQSAGALKMSLEAQKKASEKALRQLERLEAALQKASAALEKSESDLVESKESLLGLQTMLAELKAEYQLLSEYCRKQKTDLIIWRIAGCLSAAAAIALGVWAAVK